MHRASWRFRGSFIGLAAFFNHRSGRVLSYALGLVLAATLVHAVTPVKPVQAAPPEKPACPTDRPDRASAVLAARWCGGKVEVSGER